MDRSADATFNCFFPPGACRFRKKTGFLAQRMSMGESYFFFFLEREKEMELIVSAGAVSSFRDSLWSHQ